MDEFDKLKNYFICYLYFGVALLYFWKQFSVFNKLRNKFVLANIFFDQILY